jgi:hypothetical protein
MAAQGIDLLGLLSGGRAQIDAAALSAKAGSVAQDLRAELLARFVGLGEKVGAHMGADFPEAIAQGARKGAGAANAAAVEEYAPGAGRRVKIALLALLGAGVLGYILWKRR